MDSDIDSDTLSFNPTGQLTSSESSSKDIQAFLDGVLPLTYGKSKPLIILSAITLAFLAMNPEIDFDTLSDGVRQTSEFISLYLVGYGDREGAVN